MTTPTTPPRDGCAGYRDYWGEFDCGYPTTLTCEQCIYGPKGGRGRNPQAKRNTREDRRDD